MYQAKQIASYNNDLIDTLWNVKKTPGELLNTVARDLIDTLWNVKFSTKESMNKTGEI